MFTLRTFKTLKLFVLDVSTPNKETKKRQRSSVPSCSSTRRHDTREIKLPRVEHLSNILPRGDTRRERDNEQGRGRSNSTSSDFIDLCKSFGGDNLFCGVYTGGGKRRNSVTVARKRTW